MFQSHARTRPQTFRHFPIETNDQCGRKDVPQKYIAILIYISTSCGIQSQSTHCHTGHFLIFLFLAQIEYTFFSLEIINPKNIDKNILEISDQNRINIKVTLLYFSTNQLKTQNKNILQNAADKLIKRKIFRLHNTLLIIRI